MGCSLPLGLIGSRQLWLHKNWTRAKCYIIVIINHNSFSQQFLFTTKTDNWNTVTNTLNASCLSVGPLCEWCAGRTCVSPEVIPFHGSGKWNIFARISFSLVPLNVLSIMPNDLNDIFCKIGRLAMSVLLFLDFLVNRFLWNMQHKIIYRPLWDVNRILIFNCIYC